MNTQPQQTVATFVDASDPDALTKARNDMARAAAGLIAVISPMPSPDQHAAVDEVLRHGGRLTCEQGSDLFGGMSTALCLLTANGARLELSAVKWQSTSKPRVMMNPEMKKNRVTPKPPGIFCEMT